MTENQTNRLITDLLAEMENMEGPEPDYEVLRKEEEFISKLLDDDIEDADEIAEEDIPAELDYICPSCQCDVSPDDMYPSPLGDELCRWCLIEMYGTDMFFE